MYLEEIKTLLENKIAPKLFKINSEVYGFQYGQTSSKRVIKKIMLTLDLSLKSIHFAIKNKVNLIISHHGLFNKPIKYFNNNLINKLNLLSKYPISIFVLNSSFIAAENGISDTIMKTLYLELDNTFDIKNMDGVEVPIGRICTPKEYPNGTKNLKLEDILKRVRNTFDMDKILYVGDLNHKIKKICIIGGDMISIKLLNKAERCGFDCFISGKLGHHEAIHAKEIGLSLIEISHYKNEIMAMKKLCNLLSLEFPFDEFILFESTDPIEHYP